MAQRLLFEAYVDGEWAGMIAGRVAGREPADFGMHGYRISEELLRARVRGLGLGTALQRQYIDALPPTPDAIVHGAIHPLNAASLVTAKRVGHIEVMHIHFVEL